MKRSWETVIEPMLEAARPKSIVEIGSFEGENTRNLLSFCEKTGAVLHVVDPAPRYDVSDWQERYGERFVFYKALSLDALPAIGDFDVVLIDGDHNWYTVFNELRLIERLCRERSRDFPLVLLHDVFWPAGRRDQYYAPETIPEAYRKPHDPKGVQPGVEEHLEEGGLNRGLEKALQEGGPRNGVLTAIEDFLAGTEEAPRFLTVPGFHGIGVLVPLRLEQDARFAEVLETWKLPPAVRLHMERLEETWLEKDVYRLKLHARQDRMRTMLQECNDRRKSEAEELRNRRVQMADARERLVDVHRRLTDIQRRSPSTDQDGLTALAEELQLAISLLSSRR